MRRKAASPLRRFSVARGVNQAGVVSEGAEGETSSDEVLIASCERRKARCKLRLSSTERFQTLYRAFTAELVRTATY